VSEIAESRVRRINEYFRTALRRDVECLEHELLITDEQAEILRMFYVQGKNVNLIADMLGWSANKINKELAAIRRKLERII